MAAPFDPNFEFDAPKFHDFTNPCQDDDADAFFETCNHESLPTGESSKQFVTGQEGDDAAGSSTTASRASLAEDGHAGTGDESMNTDMASADEKNVEKENLAMPTHGTEAPGAMKVSAAGGCKSASKLTENIMALAGFKGKEAELTKIAQSTVATAAEVVSSPSAGEEGPIATRTRRSLEGAKKSIGSARKGPQSSGKGARKSDEKKRVHNGGASSTPSKSVAKKPRTEEKRPVEKNGAKTPTFSRFGGARGRSAGVSATPEGRSSSAPAPRSARRMADAAASPSSLMRPTSSSKARESTRSASSSSLRQTSASSTTRLTVPTSPNLASAQRSSRKRDVGGDFSSGSLGDVSLGRLSTGSLYSDSRPSMGGSARKLTVPKSPKLRSSMRSRKSTVVSADDAKMREALEAVENLKKRRKLGEARLKGEGGGGGVLPTKSLTVPQSPNLTARSRGKELKSSVDAELPFGERMAKMERSGRSKTPVAAREGGAPRLTEPKTPKFSSFRRMGAKVKSAAEREEEELEEARRNQFKARPVNRSALESCGDLGVRKIARKALTQPTGPNLSTSERGVRSRSSSMDSLSSLSSSSLHSLGSISSFKARRVPKSTHQRPESAAAAVPAREKKLTIPVSPNLRSSSRMRASSVSASSSEENLAKSFKALDMPDLTRKFVPKHDAAKLTEPAPFNLSTDKRHILKEADLQARQQAEERKMQEARRYKANPLRSPSSLNSVGVSAVNQRPLTEPKPFVLQSEAKHEHFAAQWSARVDQEREEERTKFSSFHARPVPKAVLDADRVFTPRRSGKPLTEVLDVQLNVDRRSQKHQELSQRKAEREKRVEAERLAEEQRRKEEEAREVRNLRRSMVIKAKAVPSSIHNGGPAVVHSSKPLTEPMSPHFRTDMRLRSART